MNRLLISGVLFSGIVVIVYGWPHLLGLGMAHIAGPWLGGVFFGDLVGCIFLFRVLNLRKTAITMYLGLTTIDAILLSQGFVSTHTLMWMQDIVPAIVAGIVLTGRLVPFIAGPASDRDRSPKASPHSSAARPGHAYTRISGSL